MKHVFFILLLLSTYTIAYGQDSWDNTTKIKMFFIEEDYGQVIALCEDDYKTSVTMESTDHDFNRQRMFNIANECLKLMESAQSSRKNDPEKAKVKLEQIRKIRIDNWRKLIGDNQPIRHPQTELWIEEIQNTRKKLIQPILPSYNNNVSTKIISNTFKFLSNLNDSHLAGDDKIKTDLTYMTPSFEQYTDLMWKKGRFYSTTTDQQIKNYPLVRLSNKGWIMLNIPITFEQGEKSKISIEFTSDGKISGIKEVLPELIYKKVEYNTIIDTTHFKVIRAFIDSLWMAYVNKDIDFIEKAFSEYAIIIVGKDKGPYIETNKEVPTPTIHQNSKERYEFSLRSKEQYIKRLKHVFQVNKEKRMNIQFSEIEVQRNHNFEYLYGVTLKQMWYSSTYSDMGWLFFLIKFRENEKPIIFVRTWQPLERGRETVFGFNDFELH